MKASVAQQMLLLNLAQLDTQLLQLERKLQQLPVKDQLAQLADMVQPVRAQQLQLQRQAEALALEISRIEDDLKTVSQRAAHDEKLLAATSDSKVAQSATVELEHLAVRRAQLEDQELALMEQTEELATTQQEVAARLAQLDAQREQLTAQLGAETAELNAQLEGVREQRAGQAAEITGDLLAEYERLRERTGIGAARFYRGISEASNMELSPGEIAQIADTPVDELVYCPLTGAILVRVTD